jgi:hypothetical protein
MPERKSLVELTGLDGELPLEIEQQLFEAVSELAGPQQGPHVAETRRVIRSLPSSRAAMARPKGVGRALATYEIPIEGRDEWLAAARRLA